MSDLQENSINEPWSSHCNLAACEAAGDSMVQRIMKRNSCTQTATSGASAYSKTGGKIVSASRTRRSAKKHVAVGVQTLPREVSSTLVTAEPDVYDAKYANLQKPCAHYQNGTKCRDQSCQTHTAPIVQRTCVRCKQSSSETALIRSRKDHQGDVPAVSQQTQTNYASDNSTTESAHRHVSQSGSVQPKQKEAKNQINASKSKCCAHSVCSSGADNKNASGTVRAKRTEHYKRSFTTCSLCLKQKPTVDVSNTVCSVCQKNPSCTHNNVSEVEHIPCGNACECDNIVNDVDRRIIIGKSRQNYDTESQGRMRALDYSEQSDTGRICDCANDCAACHNLGTTAGTLRECCSSGKIDNNGSCRFECHLKIAERQPQTQIYSDSSQDSDVNQQHKVQSSLKCSCDEACSCSNNQAKDIVKGKARKSYASKPNYINDTSINTERNYKHCRACGAMYQNTRKCGCRQTYPKAVAYELSFTKENVSKNEISDIAAPKISKQSLNAAKSDDLICPCDIVKRNNSSKNLHQTSTLQVKIRFLAYK